MKNILIKLKGFLDGFQGVYRWEWAVLAILIFVPFISCFYGDTKAIILYENDFWGSIFNGNGLLSYYEYVMNRMDETGMGNYATYEFPMYIVLGLWGAPLWIIMGAKDIDPLSSIFSKLYGKSIYLVALVITIYLIYLICKELKLSKKNSLWGAFIYASSLIIYIAICLNGQTDILGMIFILLGIWAYIKDSRKFFLLFFAIAIPFKQYALFIFLPLMLLKEKRVFYIILNSIAALSISVLSNLFFDSASPAIQIKNSFELDIFNRLTANRLPLLNGSVPTVVVFLVAICVYCYIKKLKDKEEQDKYTVFIPLLVMGCVFISFESSSYWYIHLAPYLAIMSVYNSSRTKHIMLFETTAMASLTLANYGSRPWAFDINNYRDMFLGKLLGNYDVLQTPILLGDFCQRIGIIKYCGALFGVYVVLLFTVIIICRPSKIQTSKEVPFRAYTYMRMLINAFIAYIPGMLYLYNVYLANHL